MNLIAENEENIKRMDVLIRKSTDAEHMRYMDSEMLEIQKRIAGLQETSAKFWKRRYTELMEQFDEQ